MVITLFVPAGNALHVSIQNKPVQRNILSSSRYAPVSCPLVLDNASKPELLNLINDTKIENAAGACALAALSYYNGSGVLAENNISINLTLLNQQFLSGNPNLTIQNSSTVKNSFSQVPNLFCIVDPPFGNKHDFGDEWNWSDSSWQNRTRMLKCVAFTLPKNNFCGIRNSNQTNNGIGGSNQITETQPFSYNGTLNIAGENAGEYKWINQQLWQLHGRNNTTNASNCRYGDKISAYRFNLTIPRNITSGPEVIFIPSKDMKTTAIQFKNNTLVVVNYFNTTQNQQNIRKSPNNSSDPATSSPIWAGYFVYENNYTNISGTWIVQPALSSFANRQSSQWVGIGGTSSILASLVQIGTHSNYINGGATYYAWYETFPLPETSISGFNVNSGDKITASVGLINNPSSILQEWQLKINDTNTRSNLTTIILSYNVPLTSAEWIDERPGSLIYPPFTNFINASYLSGNATSALGITEPISSWGNVSKIDMVNNFFGSVDIGNNVNTTSLTQSSGFNVDNFRIGRLLPLQQSVITGENYSVKLITIYNDSEFTNNVISAVGGTGIYAYDWQIKPPESTQYENLSGCSIIIFIKPGPTCTIHTNSSTQTGTYEVRVLVNALGGPSNETLTSAPVIVNVVPSVSSTCGSEAKTGIDIYNSQGMATGSNFQQTITVDSASPSFASEEDPNLQNVEFFYANCTVIPAWIESGNSNSATNTIYWLKLPASIPAYNHGSIFIGFMPLETNNFLNSSILGEAPQLSSTYGQYDNGADVFNYYNNFVDSAAGWVASNGTAATENNGLTLTFSRNGYFVGPSETYGTAFDVDVISDAEINIGYINTAKPISFLGGTAWESTVIREACSNTYPDQINQSAEANACGISHGSILPGTESATGIFSIIPYSPSSSFQYIGYITGSSSQPITTDTPGYPAPVGFAQMRSGAQINSISIQWARVRNAPPNGVMPSYAVDPFNSSTTTSITTTSSTTIIDNATNTTTTTTI